VQAYQGRAMHSACLHSRLAAGSESKHERSISVPDKVLFPKLVLRVEQGRSMTTQGSDGCLPRGFRAVTGRTSQAQIIKQGKRGGRVDCPAMIRCDSLWCQYTRNMARRVVPCLCQWLLRHSRPIYKQGSWGSGLESCISITPSSALQHV
jgi:hypothetical protein